MERRHAIINAVVRNVNAAQSEVTIGLRRRSSASCRHALAENRVQLAAGLNQ
jgi:hypothetical protein